MQELLGGGSAENWQQLPGPGQVLQICSILQGSTVMGTVCHENTRTLCGH